MNKGSKVGIVCCSNGQLPSNQNKLNKLENTLTQLGLIPVFGDFIYRKNSVFSGSGKERAQSLMNFYRDEEIQAIFDISGGDIANEILPYLDYDLIARSRKMFWGYSDLTTVLNAVYAKAGVKSVLYQIKNLIDEDSDNQIRNFSNTIFERTDDLYRFRYKFVQGQKLCGVVVGGNIRCLLKLAGTEYLPDMHEKVLLLESFSGGVPQMVTCLNQLQQMGVFHQVNGILLGTFTKMEENDEKPSIVELVQQYAGTTIPIVKTEEIGHGKNAKGIVIGEEICINQETEER